MNARPNERLNALSPETFEVSAKVQSKIWDTQQYRGDDQRELLMKTTDRGYHNIDDTETMEKLRESKHNKPRTNIMEFSDAAYRNTTFVNPKYGQC